MLDNSVAIIYLDQLTGYLMNVSVSPLPGGRMSDAGLASPEDSAKALAYCLRFGSLLF
jgi:hypothetical protein